MANDLMKSRNHEMIDQLNDWFGFPKDFFDDTSIKNIMQSDVAETDKDYIVKIDMPGMDKNDINVSYNNGTLTASGSRKAFKNLDDKKGTVIHEERSIGRIQRSYHLPDVNAKQITAKDENGVLTVTLPKQSAQDNSNNITVD